MKKLIRINKNTGSETKSDADKVPARLALSVKEAAGTIGVSESSVRRLIARGLLKPSRVLRHLRIPIEQLKTLLN